MWGGGGGGEEGGGGMTPRPDCNHSTLYSECLEAVIDCLLEQIVTSPTRVHNTLDLFFATNPTLVGNVSIQLGLSDNDIVLDKVRAKPELIKQVPVRLVYIRKLTETS